MDTPRSLVLSFPVYPFIKALTRPLFGHRKHSICRVGKQPTADSLRGTMYRNHIHCCQADSHRWQALPPSGDNIVTNNRVLLQHPLRKRGRPDKNTLRPGAPGSTATRTRYHYSKSRLRFWGERLNRRLSPDRAGRSAGATQPTTRGRRPDPDPSSCAEATTAGITRVVAWDGSTRSIPIYHQF